jgi:putative hydrolase of the HAD superfamily
LGKASASSTPFIGRHDTTRTEQFCKAKIAAQCGVSARVAIGAKTTFHRPSVFVATKNKEKSLKAIFFDAVGTLFRLTETVGDHYAYVGSEVGLDLNAQALERAFHAAWKRMPQRAAIDGPRENDDKNWWRELVDLILDQVVPSLGQFDRDNFFEIAYEHFAEAGVWELYPEVPGVLEKLQPLFQLAVVSNFDGRLRFILEHLGVSKYFARVFVSSELGADKPDPEIYRRALKLMKLHPNEVLHVGDDPERDWESASATGLSIFRLDRPKNSLRDLVTFLES